MKPKRTYKTTIFFVLIITLVIFYSSSAPGKSQNKESNNYSPGSSELYDTIFHLDSVMFNAFNTRNLKELMTFFSEDLEFYHDLGGATNYQQNLDAFKKTFESDRKVRREVVISSFEVYPIKDYGSVEIGIHRFYVTENGQKEKLGSEARFLHIWKKEDSQWKITRVISYGHKEY